MPPGASPELRFNVGDRVQCRTGAGNGDDAWSTGTIVKQWYREDGWPKTRFAPYQIKLDDARLIFAPMDDDRVIRSLSGLLAEGKIPVTVLTGFLGAGKTTLLNYILKANHGKRYAIIENEVGAVGVDNLLLKQAGYDKSKTEEMITLLDNGCLCCTVRGDLVEAIKGIVDAASAKQKASSSEEKVLDGIIIETTGIADPGPICKTFYGDPFCSTHCKIDGVITVVDAVHFIDQLTRARSEGAVNESAQQVGFADKILLNKVDAASPDKVEQTLQAIRGVNNFVPVLKCSIGKEPSKVPLEELLSIDSFDLSKMLDGKDIDLSICGKVVEGVSSHNDGHGHSGHGHEEHGHECGEGCDDHAHGEHGHECDDGCEHESHGHGDGHGHGHSFRHDSGIGSFVCELKGKAVDPMRFRHWMHSILEHSENLYRFKGILAMVDQPSGQVMRRVLQGVHDMVDMDAGDEWPADQPLKSQVVLIGRNLDKERFTSEFQMIGVN